MTQGTLNFKDTQCEQILGWLLTGRSITHLDALDMFGCARLGARIYDLKKLGHNITKIMVKTKTKKHVASYRMGG